MAEAQTTARANGPVIICYDGSKPAAEALSTVAGLLPGAQALVVTVWKPFAETMLAGWFAPPPALPAPDIDESERRAAEDIAQDGARRASAAGLKAEPLAVEARGAIWEAIDEVARVKSSPLVACGRRGRSAMRSAIEMIGLGSVSSALVDHASRPVLVVPSQRDGTQRQPQSSERSARSETSSATGVAT